ncbi:MAG: OB-fold domain-containing protein [Candidatus Omnitrophica bacterium]|nr:OB-fold domain-containing protein [Candidatus Omnitrophota bacterium]
MISRIRGKIREKHAMHLLLDVGDITYEILMPPAVIAAIETEQVELVTYHYHKVDQNKSVPILIGFINEVEKEFFEHFITVSGIGPKAACKALSKPFSIIAGWIAKGDFKMIKTLPGIGETKAKEIVAKLQDKIGKFGLIQDQDIETQAMVEENIIEESLAVLLQLQYKKTEAMDMLNKAIERNPDIKNSEQLLNEVYKQRQF